MNQALSQAVKQKQPTPRSQADRRQKEQSSPQGGMERRKSQADRREENNEEYVTFYLEKQFVGIPVSQVQEVILPQKVTRIPHSPLAVKGLLNLRGQIVTAIDLRVRLAMKKRKKENQDFMNIIVNDKGELFSLMVDSVGDVVTVARNKFVSTPSTLDKNWKQCCQGVYQLDHGLLVIVDVSKLMNISQ